MSAIHVYSVSLDGYTPVRYSARSRGKAMARAWRDFTTHYECSFRDFLQRAHIHRVVPPPNRHGRRIKVGGLPATEVYHPCAGHYVWFMRDGSDEILCSHHLDVARLET